MRSAETLNASQQSDANQLWRHSLQCSWTSSPELSAEGQPELSYSRFRQSLKMFLFGQWH